MSDDATVTTTAIDLLAQQRRLLDYFELENARLRAELKDWQAKTLALVDRVLAREDVAPLPVADPATRVRREVPPGQVTTSAVCPCGQTFRRRVTSKQKLCPACLTTVRRQNVAFATAANPFHHKAGDTGQKVPA